MASFIKKFLFYFSSLALANPVSAPYEVSLFTGIGTLVKLGDPVSLTVKQIQKEPEKLAVSESEELRALKIEEGLSYRELGLKIYYRNSGAVLIILQEPFSGKIRAKKTTLFPFGPAPSGTWEQYLVRDLGIPDFTVTGGRLNSTGLFYSWGDISFNAMGPNQLALYREPAIAKYREKNFGREVQIMPATGSEPKKSN